MMNQTIELRACPTPAMIRRRKQLRRRYEILNTALEAILTLGIGACFVVCTILLLCIA